MPPGPLPHVPLANMQGVDIERTAVMIARVTLWMGHRQMIERYGEAEDPLPLVTPSGIQVGRPADPVAGDRLHHREPAVPRVAVGPRCLRR